MASEPSTEPSAEPSREPRPEPRRGRRRVLAALALGTLVAFVAAELLTRAILHAPLVERLPLMVVRSHPTRGFEMIPRSEHYTYLEHVRVNELGLRGPDVGAKAPGELRVLLLGDSTTFGQGVAEDGTLPALLERELANEPADDLGGSVRVINGGVRSYNTDQEIALLEDLAPRIEPDVVVLCWHENDLRLHDLQALARRLAASGPVVFDFGEPDGAAARARWHVRQLARRSASLMLAHDVWRVLAAAPEDPAALEHGFERLDAGLARLAELAGRDGFEACVATIPAWGRLLHHEEPDPPVARVFELARSRGLAAIDLRPGVRALALELDAAPVLPFDGHYDARANLAMARELAKLVAPALARRRAGAR